jgi:hypothetical protein
VLKPFICKGRLNNVKAVISKGVAPAYSENRVNPIDNTLLALERVLHDMPPNCDVPVFVGTSSAV